jgi:hypothetical protein
MYPTILKLGSETGGAMVRRDDILPTTVLEIGAPTELIIAGRSEENTVPGVPGGKD